MEAVVEGRLGRVTVDDAGEPTVARLSIGCYEMVGGDSTHPLARDLVASVRPRQEIVYGNDPDWRRLVLDVHGSLVDRPMEIFSTSFMDLQALARRLETTACPRGYRLAPMDAALTRQLDAELHPHALQVFPTPEAFIRDGLGFGIVAEDGTLACAATSYTVSSRLLEIAIATREAHRSRGLAEIAARALIVESFRRGLEPQWSASNPVSKRLAERVGFMPWQVCEVLYLP